jgi:hypothetical protein
MAFEVNDDRSMALVHSTDRRRGGPKPNRYVMTGWRRTESGRPAVNIQFNTATPTADPVSWATKPRARNRGPISVF